MRGTAAAVLAGAAVACAACAAEEIDPGTIVTNPRAYLGRTVTVTVRFGKINNIFRGWESEANLKPATKIKFIAMPLAEIACYADKNAENEELIGGLRPGQELTVTGYVKKYKMEAKVKGERHTVKRSVQGSEVYGFVVKKIESVGEAPQGRPGGMGGAGRRMMRR